MEKYFIYELSCIYDSRKSFYNKAIVWGDEDGNIILLSYNTPVVRFIAKKHKWEFTKDFNYSQTTLRHVKEFCKQNNLNYEVLKAEAIKKF